MDLVLLSIEKYLKMEMNVFSVDYNYIDISEILNIDMYLMTKDNIK